jgi:hypothetical protein
MMVSDSGSPSMAMGWNAGRLAGSAGVGRLDIKPEFSNWRLKSCSLIGAARLAAAAAGEANLLSSSAQGGHLLGRQSIEVAEHLGEFSLRHGRLPDV